MAHKILIVDDDPHIFKLITFYLGSENYEYTRARNGEEALKQLDEDVYDLLLLDMLMPGMDGMTFLERLREAPPSDMQIIIITARDPEKSIFDRISEQAYDFIQKPFTANRLKLTVRNALLYQHLLQTCRNLKSNRKQ